MAISYNRLAISGSTTNAASYNTESVSPAIGSPVIIGVVSITGAAPNAPTVTGCNLTWTKVEDTLFDTTHKISLYYGVGPAATSGAITIAFGGQTQYSCAWEVVQLLNADNRVPVVQSAEATVNGTTVTATLSSFSSSLNATIGWVGHETDEAKTVSPGTGFTNVGTTSNYDTIIGMFEFKSTNDTTVDATRSGSSIFSIIGAEIKHKRSSGGFLINFI